MPSIIANWFMETILPRILAGLISAIYIGEVIDAAPTPTPPIILKIINSVRVLGKAVPKAEIRKKKAEMISVFFLPSLSLNMPAIETPIMQPIRAQLAAQPLAAADKSNLLLRNPIAPDITAVSYPNNSPPRAATKHT